jgi:hypothetical protein
MKRHLPRIIVGLLLLAMAGIMFGVFGVKPLGHVPLARLALLLAIAFIGTQVLFGRRLPGFRRRTRNPQ